MSASSQTEYREGEVVWVKLSNVWWPGEVCGDSTIPEGLISSLKKKPIAVVRFFQEDTFEYVRNGNEIRPYNCPKKMEFIKKGLDLHKTNNKYADKFPGDVSKAEELTHGDPNIVNSDVFIPKDKVNVSEIFGTTDRKRKQKGKDKVSPKRGRKSSETPSSSPLPSYTPKPDYTARILDQPMSSPAEVTSGRSSNCSNAGSVSGNYRCSTCDFSTNRLNLFILHNKNHPKESKSLRRSNINFRSQFSISDEDNSSLRSSIKSEPDSDQEKSTTRSGKKQLSPTTRMVKRTQASAQKTVNKNPKKTPAKQENPVMVPARKPPGRAAKKEITIPESTTEDDGKINLDIKSELLDDWSEDSNDAVGPSSSSKKSNSHKSPIIAAKELSPENHKINDCTQLKADIEDILVSTKTLANNFSAIMTPSSSGVLNKKSKESVEPKIKCRNIPKKERRDIFFEEFNNTVDSSTSTSTINVSSGTSSIVPSSVETPIVNVETVTNVSERRSSRRRINSNLLSESGNHVNSNNHCDSNINSTKNETSSKPVAKREESCFDFNDDEDVITLTKSKDNGNVNQTVTLEIEKSDDGFYVAGTPKKEINTLDNDRNLPIKERGKRFFKTRSSQLLVASTSEEKLSTDLSSSSPLKNPTKHDLQIAETLIRMPEQISQKSITTVNILTLPSSNPNTIDVPPLTKLNLNENEIKHATRNDKISSPKSTESKNCGSNDFPVIIISNLTDSAIEESADVTTEKDLTIARTSPKVVIERLSVSNLAEEALGKQNASLKTVNALPNPTNTVYVPNASLVPSTKSPGKNLVKIKLDRNAVTTQSNEKIVVLTIPQNKVESSITSKSNITKEDTQTSDNSEVISNIQLIPLTPNKQTQNENVDSVMLPREDNIISSQELSEHVSTSKNPKVILKNVGNKIELSPVHPTVPATISSTQLINAESGGQIIITSKGAIINASSTHTTIASNSNLIITPCTLSNSGNSKRVIKPPAKIEIQSQKIICPPIDQHQPVECVNSIVSSEIVKLVEPKLSNIQVTAANSLVTLETEILSTLQDSSQVQVKEIDGGEMPPQKPIDEKKMDQKKSNVFANSKGTTTTKLRKMSDSDKNVVNVNDNNTNSKIVTKPRKRLKSQSTKDLNNSSSNDSKKIKPTNNDAVISVENQTIIESEKPSTSKQSKQIESQSHKTLSPSTISNKPPLTKTNTESTTTVSSTNTSDTSESNRIVGSVEIETSDSPIPMISEKECSAVVEETIIKESDDIQDCSIIAVGAEDLGGPPNSYFLCTMGPNGNFIPIDQLPRYLDSTTGQLVPGVPEFMMEKNGNDDGTASTEELIEAEENAGQPLLSELAQIPECENQTFILNTEDGQQIVLDQQSLIALAAGGDSVGQSILSIPDLVQGEQIIIPIDGQRSEDILAAALASTDVFTQDNLIPNSTLVTQPMVGVLPNSGFAALTNATNAVLTQPPRMATIEQPTKKNVDNLENVSSETGLIGQNLEDSLAVIGVGPTAQKIPTSLELPITVTNPAIAPKTTCTNPISLPSIYSTTTFESPTIFMQEEIPADISNDIIIESEVTDAETR